MQAMGVPLTTAERKAHADQLFNAKHYSEAGEEYHSIARSDSTLSATDQAALSIYAAVCDLKLKHLSRRDVERLPETTDDSAALKMYMLAEISRSEKNPTEHDSILAEMVKRFPGSRWLEEALYSGGNMYLIQHDSKQAIYHYTLLVKNFPNSTYAPSSHWRAAWMNYRLRNYAEAARLMDEQIERYEGGIEIPTALYWRGRIYEDEEHNFGQAINYYRVLAATYNNYYYGELARQRMKVLGGKATPAAPAPVLAAVKKPAMPTLIGELPENDPHLIKAKLLANAALNEYIGPEIQASPDSQQWGALAEAEIYSSYGEVTRALQSMKHSGISYFALPVDRVPMAYWKLLFPQPYKNDLAGNSQKNGLDPALVASLIRQESEFNPGAISRANAYGLMQLLPSVGRAMARKTGMKSFTTNQLLNPSVNIQLGTANLKQVLNRFGGQEEYALAAYNAGDVPIRQWLSSGDYKDIAEFVESIPYTETREYVQAILRNREMYRTLYPSW
jgi:soluble lytic murein transglycosylase